MNDLTLKAQIEILLKGGKIPADVGANLKRLATEAESAKTHTERFSKSLSALNGVIGAVGITLSASAIIAFAKTAYVEFAKTERIFRTVETQLGSLGGKAGYTGGQMRQMIAAMTDQFGILDDDLVPAYNRLLISFGDGKAAMEALQISAKFAANGLGTVQSNAEALATGFQTGVLRGLKEFGIQTKSAAGDTLDFADAVGALKTKLDKLPSSFDDAQHRLDTFASRMDDIGDSVGETLDALANLPQSTLDTLHVLFGGGGAGKADVNPTLLASMRQRPTLETEPGGADSLEALAKKKRADIAAAQAKEDAKKAAEEAKKAADEEVALAQKVADELAAIKKKNADDFIAIIGKELAAKRAASEEAKKIDKDANAAFMDQIDVEQQAVIDAADEMLQLQLDIATEAADALLNQNIEAWTEANRVKTELLLEQLDREEAAALAGVTAGSDAEKAILALYAAKRLALHARTKKAEVTLTRQAELAKRAAVGETLQQVGAIVGALFGKNKKVAIAAAIIDTIGAAIKSYNNAGGYPQGLIPMAASLALGFAQISQMRSTTPDGGGSSGGGGGGGGGGSALAPDAYVGQAARSPGYQVNDGFALNPGGSAAGASGSTSGGSSGTIVPGSPGAGNTTIDLRGSVFSDRRSMRKLERQLRRASPSANAGNLR